MNRHLNIIWHRYEHFLNIFNNLPTDVIFISLSVLNKLDRRALPHLMFKFHSNERQIVEIFRTFHFPHDKEKLDLDFSWGGESNFNELADSVFFQTSPKEMFYF